MEHLYVLEFANATVKVGRSQNVEKRVAQHRSMGKAMGNPVRRVWVSDGHEDSRESERRLLVALGPSTYGNEWFDGVLFDDAVQKAKDSVQLVTEPELFEKRLQEAKRLLESYTGRHIGLEPVRVDSDVRQFFDFDPEYFVMSAQAFEHYQQSGGELHQKAFIAALEAEGVRRHRTNFGTRLLGIAPRTAM